MTTVVESTNSLSRSSVRRPVEAPRSDHLLRFDAVLQGSGVFSTSPPTASRTPLPSSDDYRPVAHRADRSAAVSGASSEPATEEQHAAEDSPARGPRADEDSSADGQKASPEASAGREVADTSSQVSDGEADSHESIADAQQARSDMGGSRGARRIGSDEEGQSPVGQTNVIAVDSPAAEGNPVDGSSEQADDEKADGQQEAGRTQAIDRADGLLAAERSERTSTSDQKGPAGARAVVVPGTAPSAVLDKGNAEGSDPAIATHGRRRASRQKDVTINRAQRATNQDVDVESARLEPNSETAPQRSAISLSTVVSSAVKEISSGDGSADEAASKTTDPGSRPDATPPSAGGGSRQDASGRLSTGPRVEAEAGGGRGPLGPGETHRFVQRVSRAIELSAQRGESLQIRLSPPELGSVRVEIAIRAGVLTAHLEADSTAARTALLDNLPVLRDRLAEQEIRIERFEVDVREDADGRSRERSPAFQFRERAGEGAGLIARRRPSPSSAGQPEPAVRTRLSARIGHGQLNLLV